ncbi:MAG: aromatic amino acid ammonia-lyase, partial [Flavobacteriaceae bacterium]|nr:aromatic amino acid ammonia-lyase [Flavobacteriaceae bacterium]
MDHFHIVNTDFLDLNTLNSIFFLDKKLKLSEEVQMKITTCRLYLDEKLTESEDPIYGINTGFGSLYNVKIDKNQLSQLQENLVMSHACGTGDEVPAEIVKMMLFLKIQSLSYGYSG